MKYYVAYRFTVEEKQELEETMKKVCGALESNGYDTYCSFFDPRMNNIGNKNVLLRAFNEIDNSDVLLVFIKSNDKSEGMLELK